MNQDTATALQLHTVSVSFDTGTPEAIHGVSLNIPAGKISVLIGPNGCGKTTLLRAILGLQEYRGTITYFGGQLSEHRRELAYVPQRYHVDPLSPMTAREFLLLFADSLPAEQLQKELQVLAVQFGVEKILTQPLRSLSGGQLQRVLLCRAFITHPKLLVLDEPEAGVDATGGEKLFHFLQKETKRTGLTVVMASHELEMVSEHADHIVCLNRKVLCTGAPHQVLKGATLKQLFGAHTGVYVHQ